MSNQPQLGFDHSILDLSTTMAPPPMSQGQSASSSGNPDWIPPPASLTAINSDGIDLNDEIFFNYNPVPSHTPYTETYAISNDVEASSSTSSIATLPYNALQSTITTPDLTLASPQKFDANLHYSHRRRFSSAVEQLNRMSIHQHKSKSPSPDVYPVLAHPANPVEERTINPRQLLGINSGGMSGATSAGQNTVPASSRYILPSSVSSPSLSTFFSRGGDMVDMDFQGQEMVANGISGSLDMSEMQEIPLSANGDGVIGVNSYVMNDECVSAITSWLNNTDNIISDRAEGAAMRNPTGIVKPNWKRRNSIQVLPHRNEAAPQRMPPSQKRKRRKSINNSIPEDMVPAQVYQNSQSPGTSYAPQFSSMNSFGMEPELQQDQSPVSGHEVSEEAFQRTNEALRTQETPRYGSISTVPMVEKPASRQLSVTDGDDEPKPFPCPECEKQFKRSEHLKRHIRSVHSNIRPFHCKYCDKKFSRSDNLAQHSKTHFKVNANGTTTIIYGNPNPNNRGGRKKSVSSDGGQGTGQDSQ